MPKFTYWDDPHTNHLHPRKKNEEFYFLRQRDAIFDGKQENSGPLLSHVGPPPYTLVKVVINLLPNAMDTISNFIKLCNSISF